MLTGGVAHRNTGGQQQQQAGASTTPQWGGSAAPAQPAHVDRHTASQAYQQRYFGDAQPSSGPEQPAALDSSSQGVRGYSVDAPAPAPTTQSKHHVAVL